MPNPRRHDDDLVYFLLNMVQPPDLLEVVHDTIMAWATEAIEHAGLPRPRRAGGGAVLVYDFKRLNELSHQDAQVRVALDNAERSVKEAARQLATARPNTRAWYEAKQVFDRAVSQLRDVSIRLVQLAGTGEDVRVGVRSLRLAGRRDAYRRNGEDLWERRSERQLVEWERRPESQIVEPAEPDRLTARAYTGLHEGPGYEDRRDRSAREFGRSRRGI